MRAARENGKLGGRPRKQPSIETFEDLELPPSGPLERIRWCQDLLVLDMFRMAHGGRSESDKELSRDLRATAAVVAKLMPADITVEALRLLQEDGQQLTGDSGPETVPVTGPMRSIGR